jgi:hypothetical protein
MRRGTWILLAILLVVAGLWYLLHSGRLSLPAALRATATPTTASRATLFSSDQGTINGLKVEGGQQPAVEFQRGAGGSWSLLQPKIAPADSSLAESAATQAGDLAIVATLDPGTQLAELGLDKPDYTITLETSVGNQVFQVGKPTVTGSGYYVKTPVGSLVVVTKYGLDALIGLLTSPPYAATPTPSPVGSITPGPDGTALTPSPTP